MITAVTEFIKVNPGLTALIVFIVLAIDTLYIYRTLKRHWKRSPRAVRHADYPEDSRSDTTGP